jgi:mono/diheme cytochrome c family protein
MKSVLIAGCIWMASAPWTAPRAATAQSPAATAAAATVWDAVYSQEQAMRGQEQYDVFCTGCHGPDMQGDGADVPSLSDERFARKWSGRTLKDLSQLISQTMPENRPGALSKEAYTDLLAYVLQGNGFPTGLRPLPADPDALARIMFEETAPDGQGQR